MSQSLWTRFWSKVDKRPESEGGHWLWTGAIRGSNGYGHIRDGETTVYAHRLSLAWVTRNEGIGLDAAHDDTKCCPRNCVRPDHLTWKTHSENMKDVVMKNGRLFVRAKNHRAPVAERALPLFEEGRV